MTDMPDVQTLEEAPALPALAADTVEDFPPRKPAIRSVTMHSFVLPDSMESTALHGEWAMTATPAMRIANRLLTAAAVAAPATPGAYVSSRVTSPAALSADSRPRLRVLRGLKLHAEFALADGPNTIGRCDDQPIDIDLQEQEPPDRIWTSRRHAVLHVREGVVEIEDLNSLNGTFVNRVRVSPGQRRVLQINDVVQVGSIQLRLLA